MPMPVRRWMVVVLAATVMSMIDYSATTSSDHGLGLLNSIMDTDPSMLCPYVSCQEPLSSSSCPDKTIYMENTSQFGCCGACVAFRQETESCTGNIDAMYGEGYTKGSRTRSVDFLESLYNTSENNLVHSSWCDYSLQCSGNPGFMKCGLNSTLKTCRNMLDHYLTDQNEGLYKFYRDDYRWKPVCTPDGKFDPKQCMGPLDKQRCVCVDPDGNRLFGLAFPEQEELFNTMNCKCSRQAWEKKQAGQSSVTLHCLENGNFEPLQCEDGWCNCVDPTTGELYGSRLPESAMHMLTCYNKTTIGEQYLRRCDSELHAHAKLLDAMAESGAKGPDSLTECDQDGSYTSRQCDQEMCRCWDKYKYQFFAYSSEGDCQCAVDREYYKETNSKITITCTTNTGAYAQDQVQGSYKYCVDEDGIRASPLVWNSEEYTLNCDYAIRCQENGAKFSFDYCSQTCVLRDSSPCGVDAYPNYNNRRA